MQVNQDGATAISALPNAISSTDHFIPPPTPVSAALTDDGLLSPVPDGIRDEGGARTKPKQKRNKPTLSCLECGTSSAIESDSPALANSRQ